MSLGGNRKAASKVFLQSKKNETTTESPGELSLHDDSTTNNEKVALNQMKTLYNLKKTFQMKSAIYLSLI